MERKLSITAALLFFTAILSSGKVNAQPSRAEFHLDLTLRDTTVQDGIVTLTGRSFGYDPHGSNKYDSVFGEDQCYPVVGIPGPDASDLYFVWPGTGDCGTRVQIFPHPFADSFAINYQMGLYFAQYPGYITWDTMQIPPEVTGIWLRPSWSQTPLVDMKHTEEFSIPSTDSAFLWGSNFTVTVFYGMQPRYIPAGVSSGSTSGNKLLISASAMPNPMTSSGTLEVTLSDPALISITGYDIVGHEVLRLSRTGSAGDNMIDLSSHLLNAHGAVMLRIDAQSGSKEETKDLMVVRP